MRIAFICPLEPGLIGPAGLLTGVLTKLAVAADVELVLPAGASPELPRQVKAIRADKFAQQVKRYDGIFYHIGPDADVNDWICQLATHAPGVAVLLEGPGHRCQFDRAVLERSQAVLTFSHHARRRLWKEIPQIDVRVIPWHGEAPHAELYLQALDESESMRRWLRRQVSRSIAQEVAAFGVVPDVTDVTLRRLSEQISEIL